MSDPTGRLTEFRDARSDPLLDDVNPAGDAEPASAQAAYRTVVALGYCRLFGLEPEAPDGRLPANLVLAAARRFAFLLPEWVRTSQRLGSSWDERGDVLEAEDLVVAFVEGRTDAWAAEVALREALILLTEQDDSLAEGAAAELERAGLLIDEFDRALEQHVDILSTLVETPWWSGWRDPLVGIYRDPFPWWLGDPVLEAAERF